MLRAVGLYRPARPARNAWNVTKTIIFLVCFWLIVLFYLPMGVSIVEIDMGIQRFPPQAIAPPMLLLFTLIALWAALTLAIVGEGTPLPFNTARKLVVSGPYAYIRNPLIVATGGQGVALGMTLGSIPVLLYVTIALTLWYFLVRPGEERDLEKRFGEAWRSYAQAVRTARPRLTPYRPH